MTNIQRQRKVWQPINQKSLIVATITAIAATTFQVYFWYSRATQSPSPSTPSIQQSGQPNQ